MKRAIATVVIASAHACLTPALIGDLGFIAAALARPAAHEEAKAEDAVKQAQADAVAAHDKALREFKTILAKRRAQIDAKKRLPNLPGQAIYLVRMKMMSRYRDLTDVLPSRIGRPNRFGVPPDHFDAVTIWSALR